MNDLERRIREVLEPILAMTDPRGPLSAHHDMPYALFRYDPKDEIELRRQLRDLTTRLETQKAKRVRSISLAECLDEAMKAVRPLREWFAAERALDVATLVDTLHSALAEHAPLPDLVAKRMPQDPNPERDIVFIVRAGALFPVYRTFALPEQLKGRVQVPTILFYPGTLEGPAGLRFMGVLEAEHNYRARIF